MMSQEQRNASQKTSSETALSTSTVEMALRSAEACLKAENWSQVIVHSQQAIQLKPTAAAYKLLGNARWHQKQWQEARAAYEQALKLQPDAAEIHANLGVLSAQQQYWSEALQSFRSAIALKPDLAAQLKQNLEQLWFQIEQSPGALQAFLSQPQQFEAIDHQILGDRLLQQGRFKEAVQCYENAVALDPTLATAFWNLMLAQKQLGNQEAMLNAYAQALTLQPNWASAEQHCKLGQYYFGQGQWKQAILCYERAIGQDPAWVDAYLGRGMTLQKFGKLKEAIDSYQQAIELQPDAWLTHHNLGGACLEQKQWIQAVAAYERVIALNPDYFWSHQNLGDALMQLQQWQKAVAAYEQAIALNPDYFWPHQNLGDALMQLQQWQKAAAAYERAIALNSDYFWSHQNLGDALMQLQQWQKAAAAYERAIELDPQFHWSHYNLGEAFAKLAQWDAAIQAYQKAHQIKSDLPQISEKLADAFKNYTDSNLTTAMQFYQEALQQDPENEMLYYKALEIEPHNAQLYSELAETLLNKGQQNQAIAFYQTAAYLKSDRVTAAQALHPFQPKGRHQNHSNHSRPKEFPADLILPPIIGEGNDYSLIEEKLKRFVEEQQSYTLPVSIIIPTYNRQSVLSKTLAAFTHQTYPKHLMEIIIADDGSSDGVKGIIRKYEQHLELIHVRQADLGYRLSAVRNLGVRAARHHQLIIIDCDVMPHPQLVESYMKYLHVSDRVALIGHRRFVCTDHLTDDDILHQVDSILALPDIKTGNELWREAEDKPSRDWRLKIYEETNYLKQERYPFRAFVGATVAYSKKLVQVVGNYDEDFNHWGEEDKEYGYRIYNAGYYFIPVLDAIGLHQEPPDGKNENNRVRGHEITTQILQQKCPAGSYRQYKQDEIYKVPKVSIYIPSYNNGTFIKQAIDSALNQTFTDLEVCIVDDGSTDNTLQILEENYRDHPRVRWLAQTHGGIGKASNAAVRMCRGMYIGQLDSDDVLKPHAVETLVNYLDEQEVGCVYSSCERIDAEGKYLQDEYNWPTFSREKLLTTMIVHHFRMFRKRDWMRTAGFDQTLTNAVDYDMFLKLSEVCSIHHIDQMLYLRRIHGRNTSVVNLKQQDQNNNLVITAALKRMGLADQWEIYSPDPEQPRRIAFRQKSAKRTA